MRKHTKMCYFWFWKISNSILIFYLETSNFFIAMNFCILIHALFKILKINKFHIKMTQLSSGRTFITPNEIDYTLFPGQWISIDIANCLCFAQSGSGKYQLTAVQGGSLYFSTSYGLYWENIMSDITNEGFPFISVCMSKSGQYQSACNDNLDGVGYIWISSDYGITWTKPDGNINDQSQDWKSISMDGTGRYQTAIGNSTHKIWRSADYGETWTELNYQQQWLTISLSDNGQYQSATTSDGKMFASADYGATFTQKLSKTNALVLKMNGTGDIQLLFEQLGKIYKSTDYGNNWDLLDTFFNQETDAWTGICMNYSGKYQCIFNNIYLYTTLDYGETWFTTAQPENAILYISYNESSQFQTAIDLVGALYRSISIPLM